MAPSQVQIVLHCCKELPGPGEFKAVQGDVDVHGATFCADEANGLLTTLPAGTATGGLRILFTTADGQTEVFCAGDKSCPLIGRSEEFTIEPTAGSAEAAGGPVTALSVVKKLSFLDRYLVVWVLLAMILGVICGEYYPDARKNLNKANVVETPLPIAIGLWLMMAPVFCKVRYGLVLELLRDPKIRRELSISFVANWLVGPAVMTAFAWAALPDLPGYRGGVILVGIARCIAMVLIWNQLACGHAELCSILVAFNSVLSLALYAPLAVFYLQVVSRMYLGTAGFHVSFWAVLRTVLIFLGIPVVAGAGIRVVGLRVGGERWYNSVFIPHFGPIALLSLLYTIFVMFALQGARVIAEIGDVFRVAVPMVMYFAIMWTATFAICLRSGVSYSRACTHGFTASSNNFELAIAIAVGTFGIDSQEALAATIGPLIEVPVLLLLVYVALWLQKRFKWAAEEEDGMLESGKEGKHVNAADNSIPMKEQPFTVIPVDAAGAGPQI